MRRSRSNAPLGRRAALIALASAICPSASLDAHRLDEYLQATRVAIEPDRVAIELDLTPGVSLAAGVLADIDRDRNHVVGADEARAYSARVVSELQLEIDGRALPLSLTERQFPAAEAILNGEGTIRLQLEAVVPSLASGDHSLTYRNGHRPDIGVYLANALVPTTDRVGVLAQDRDFNQRELVIAYRLRGGETGGGRWWSAGAGGVLLVLLLLVAPKAARLLRRARSS